MQDPFTPARGPDIDRLSAAHPSWSFRAAWVTAASGPDARMLTATRGDVRLSAPSAAGLSVLIAAEERARGWPAG